MLNFNKYSFANVEIKVEFVMVSRNSLCDFVGSMHVSQASRKPISHSLYSYILNLIKQPQILPTYFFNVLCPQESQADSAGVFTGSAGRRGRGGKYPSLHRLKKIT